MIELTDGQKRTRAFFYRDEPVRGLILLYALGFLVCSAVLDAWEFFDPGNSQINRYLFSLILVVPNWVLARRFEKRRAEQAQGTLGAS